MKQALLVAAALTLHPLVAGAASYVAVSDEALADDATLAVVARVRSRAPAPRRAATDYRLEIERVLAGGAPSGELVVRVPGGGAGPARLLVRGAPRFQEGERVLLFLDRAAGGAWRIAHLFLGAFHEVTVEGRRLAVRELAGARAVRPPGRAGAPSGAQDSVRDFDAFAGWVQARARGDRRSAAAGGYLLPAVDAQRLSALGAPFTLFADPDDGLHLRWFDFDAGGSVAWRAHQDGQSGLPGGGFGDFQVGLAAWTADPGTPIDLRYAGKTAVTLGLSDYDELNTIVFDDPDDLLSPFDCTRGGVLAIAGPWYFAQSEPFAGQPYHRIVNADIVTNSGISCFFAGGNPGPATAAQELFAHELGHTLGLGHSCGDPTSPPCGGRPELAAALMRALVHDDGRGAALAADDRAALGQLYGAAAVLPAAPSGLTAVALDTHTIRLDWIDNAGNETDYRLERATLGGPFQELVQPSGELLPADTVAAEATQLLPATGYRFRVRAHNGAGFSAYSEEVAASTNAPLAPCVPAPHTLCLNDGRFQVTVAWEIPDGTTGAATGVPLAAESSGLFWFFGEDNIEMLLKVLDGCPVNQRWWVYFAAATDVELTVTVVDTATGAVETYFNPQGHRADAVTDSDAFATCP